MDKESVARLRFDRRLRQRPDWIDKADQEAYLAALPDVSEKMTTCVEEDRTTEATEATEAAAAPVAEEGPTEVPTPASTVAATAGDFSASRSFGGFGGGSDDN